MRIRRWEEEEEFDRYMRDRAGESRAAARPGRVYEMTARCGAGLRDAWGHAVAGTGSSLAVFCAAVAGSLLSALGGGNGIAHV